MNNDTVFVIYFDGKPYTDHPRNVFNKIGTAKALVTQKAKWIAQEMAHKDKIDFSLLTKGRQNEYIEKAKARFSIKPFTENTNDLLEKTYKVLNKLDSAYCTIINELNDGVPNAIKDNKLTGADLDEINDLLIELKEYFK